MADEPVYNVFDSDTHRRVCAQCMRPRSASEIAYVARTLDPFIEARHRDDVQEVLDELASDGLVKQVEGEEPNELLDAQDGDGDVIDFQGDREAFETRAAHPRRYPFLEQGEAHYVMTNEGHARLTGEVPPPEGGGGPGGNGPPEPAVPAPLDPVAA